MPQPLTANHRRARAASKATGARGVGNRTPSRPALMLVLLVFALAACGQIAGPRLHVVATLAPFADWARQVGGERVTVTQLVPTGIDPRTWEPSEAALRELGNADIVLFNGLGIEPWLDTALERSGAEDFVALEIGQVPQWGTDPFRQRVPRVIPLPDDENLESGTISSVQIPQTSSPFVWLDPGPASAQRAVALIAGTFARADIDHLHVYQRNAEAYNGKLENLDSWIRRQVRQWPRVKTNVGERVAMQSADTIWEHFADQYGITLRTVSRLRVISPTLPDSTPLFVDRLSTPASGTARLSRQPDGVLHALGDSDYVRMMRANVAALGRGMHAALAASASPSPGPAAGEP